MITNRDSGYQLQVWREAASGRVGELTGQALGLASTVVDAVAVRVVGNIPTPLVGDRRSDAERQIGSVGLFVALLGSEHIQAPVLPVSVSDTDNRGTHR